MEVKPALALPEEREGTGIEMIASLLTIPAVPTHVHPTCLLCGTIAARVHSHSCYKVADLPCGGQPVRLVVEVRTYFCDVPDCARKIFVERLTPFIEPRVTQRLFQTVQTNGLARGGRLGVRLSGRLSIQTAG